MNATHAVRALVVLGAGEKRPGKKGSGRNLQRCQQTALGGSAKRVRVYIFLSAGQVPRPSNVWRAHRSFRESERCKFAHGGAENAESTPTPLSASSAPPREPISPFRTARRGPPKGSGRNIQQRAASPAPAPARFRSRTRFHIEPIRAWVGPELPSEFCVGPAGESAGDSRLRFETKPSGARQATASSATLAQTK